MIYHLTLPFILGILIGRYDHVPPASLLLLMILSLLAMTILFRRERSVMIISTCAILFLVGFWRYQSAVPRRDSTWIHFLNDGPAVTLTGQISRDPEVFGRFQRIKVGNLSLDSGQPLKGKILVKARRYPAYNYGDRVQITAELATPPEFNDFSYRDYLAAQGVYSLVSFPKVQVISTNGGNRLYRALLSFRHLLEARISQLLPEPEASLLAGVLLGVKRNLPPNFYESLQKSGTLHVVVVSGQNITYTILAFLGLGSLLLTSRTYKIALSAIGIIAYALMVGGEAAVWRATLMGLAVLIAALWGRRRQAQGILLLSAAVLLAINPQSLWQVGFQLSFAATAGIIFLQDILKDRLQVLPKLIRDGLITTLAAQAAILPVLVHNFQSLSLISPVSNLLIFWLVPLITTFGGVTALSSLLFLPLARWLSFILFVLLKAFVVIVELTAKVPLAQIEIPRLPVWVWVGYYLILVFVVVRGKAQKSGHVQKRLEKGT